MNKFVFFCVFLITQSVLNAVEGIGIGNVIDGINNDANGVNNKITGDCENVLINGIGNTAQTLRDSVIYGEYNIVSGNENRLRGRFNKVIGKYIVIKGDENNILMDNTLVFGDGFVVKPGGFIETTDDKIIRADNYAEDAVDMVNNKLQIEFLDFVQYRERRLKRLHKKGDNFFVLDVCPINGDSGDYCHSCFIIWRKFQYRVTNLFYVFQKPNNEARLQFVCIKDENQIAQVKIGHEIVYSRF